jgi:hypothetical protein
MAGVIKTRPAARRDLTSKTPIRQESIERYPMRMPRRVARTTLTTGSRLTRSRVRQGVVLG